MPKSAKINTRKQAEATVVEAAAKLLEAVSDPRTAELLDRLRSAAKTLRSEALASDPTPRRQRRLIDDDVPFPV